MPSAWRCGCAASGDVEGRAPTAEAVGGAGLTEQGLTVQGEVVTRAPGQSSWLQRRSAEWPWSPWVREQARGRAATAGVRGGAVAAAVGAGELLPRSHRLTGVSQPQRNAFTAVFQLQMHAHACVCAASPRCHVD
jgi:hypothetical protein